MAETNYHTTTAVLFVAFRRRDLAVRAFAAIRAVRPPRLYFAADGPRPHVPDDAERCAETRDAIGAMIDWPCTVLRDFPAQNIGSGRRVSSAISWAFQHEERLIIVEDDCLAETTFFRFCDELLERYATEERVAMISGNQFLPQGWPCAGASYAFGRLAQIWGWATWRRAWVNFDYDMRAWPAEKRAGLLARTFKSPRDQRYWRNNFDGALKIDSWDYQWCFARWRFGQAGIVPGRNLVSNLGFTADALHTKAPHHPAAALPLAPMQFPLTHPARIQLDDELDRHSARVLFSGGFDAWWNYQRDQRLARWLPWLFPPR